LLFPPATLVACPLNSNVVCSLTVSATLSFLKKKNS
jgi:hypothetical protein